MSGFKAKKQESNLEGKLSIGFSEFQVIAVNPTREELNNIFGLDKTEEVSYTGTTQKGDKYARVAFLLKSVDDNSIKTLSFFLEDKILSNKDETKTCFINLSGLTNWGSSKDTLPEWMTKKEVKECHKGENTLYEFLRSWLYLHDWNNNEGLFDFKRLMKGDASEISQLINTEISMVNSTSPSTVVANVVINSRSNEDSGEISFRENIFDQAFLPGKFIGELNIVLKTIDHKKENLPLEIESSDTFSTKSVKHFLNRFKERDDYPIKALYEICNLKEFEKEKYLQSSEDTMEEESPFDTAPAKVESKEEVTEESPVEVPPVEEISNTQEEVDLPDWLQ